MITVDVAEARHIAVAAAAFDTALGVPQCIERLLCVQLDSISKVSRAHQITLAARTGLSYKEVDAELWAGARPVVFEYPVHAASLVSIHDWPLMADVRHRAAKANSDWAPAPKTASYIIDQIRSRGPLTLQQLDLPSDERKGWNWGRAREAVEYLLWTGSLICCRRVGWRRLYDLPERALDAVTLGVTFDPKEAARVRIVRAVEAMGIATAADVADYLRTTRSRVLEVIEGAEVFPVKVLGWKDLAYVADPDLNYGDEVASQALGPFDNLIWYRNRVSRLFSFDHVFEAYKPAAKRQFGYYVFPVLVNRTLVARVELEVEGDHLCVNRLVIEGERNDHEFEIDTAVNAIAMRRGLQSVIYR